MLTRIEVDGFKTFRDFALDVPPFLVMLGRNASGKSNLFDALQFLRASVDGTLLDAAQQMRGDVLELFHLRSDGSRAERMRFAAEVLVPSQVTDAFGDTEDVSHTRLRYELAIELRRTDRGGMRPFVSEESTRLLKKTGDRWMRRMPPALRDQLAVYGRGRTDPLETGEHQGRPTFVLKSGSQGRPRLLPASEATATVLSSLSTARDYPLLYALKRELESWRLLQLDPAALRAPSSYDDPDALETNGAGLANALQRISDETATDDRPDGVLSHIVADLAAVIPGVRDLQVVDDEIRRQRYLEVTMRGEAAYSARVASDGTLRALALLTALYDPRDTGLICFEEPENGMFPARLADFVAKLQERIAAAVSQTDRRSFRRQLLLSSHSPTVLHALEPMGTSRPVRNDVVFVDTVTRVEPSAPRSRTSRVRWLRPDATEVAAPAADVLGADAVEEEDVPAHQILSDSEVAEFEVRRNLGSG